MISNRLFAADSTRVNNLISNIYKELATCSVYNPDSAKLLRKLELSNEQKAALRFNHSQKLYCTKNYTEALLLIDSLLKPSLSNNQNQYFTAKLQFQKGKLHWALQNFDEALQAFDENIVFSKLINAQKIEGLCHYYKGRIFETQQDYLQATKSYQAAIEPLQNSKKKFVGEIYKSIGIIYRKMGLNAEAIQQYNMALDNYFSTEYDFGIASIYNSMANILVLERDFEKAEAYFNIALEYNKRISDGRSIELNISNNLGLLYIEIERYNLAIAILQKALIMAKAQKNPMESALALGNLAIAYKGIGQYNTAINYYYKALKLKKLSNSKLGEVEIFLGLGNAHFRNNNLDSALYFYRQIESQLDKQYKPTFLITYYNYWASYYKAQKNWQMAVVALDSVFSISERNRLRQHKNLLASYSMLFNTKAKEYENALLEKSIESEKEKVVLANDDAKNKNLLFILSLAAFVSISVVSLLLVKNKKKLEDTNKELQQVNSNLQISLEENRALISIVAHDLKTPINQFKGLIGLVKMAGEINKEQEEYLQLMEDVALNGDKIVQDLVLAYSEDSVNMSIEHLRVCHLLSLAKSRFVSQLQAKGMELQIQCADEFEVMADESSLSRILDNLISNAIKFSGKGAEIVLEAKMSQNGKEISITDTGPGIAENEMHKLFKRYTKLSAKPTSGESSTGLGLFIVKNLLNKMKADIKVASELGKGATFTLIFSE